MCSILSLEQCDECISFQRRAKVAAFNLTSISCPLSWNAEAAKHDSTVIWVFKEEQGGYLTLKHSLSLYETI